MTRSTTTANTEQPCLPRRRADLHVEELDGEAVLYDPGNGAVHRFNETTLLVWHACDGTRTAPDLAREVLSHGSASADEASRVVCDAIRQLDEKELLTEGCRLLRVEESRRSPPQESSTTGAGVEMQTARPDALERLPAPTSSPGHGVSRRELLGSGVTTAVLAAPVISTFFASGAYASDWRGSANGPGGCKNIGFSCVVNADCCKSTTNTACQAQGAPTKTCCVQHNKTGCRINSECCNLTDVCVGGMCQ